MSSKRYKKALRRLGGSLLALAMMLSCSIQAFADPSPNLIIYYLGTDNVSYVNNSFNYDIKGYVHCDYNNTTSVKVAAMVQWIYNYGINDIDEFLFLGYSGDYSNYRSFPGYLDSPITTGHNTRLEIDWYEVTRQFSKTNVYLKNGSDNCAITGMYSGSQYAVMGGWTSYWLPTSREDDFGY